MFSSHTKKFLSYYKPYLGLFFSVLAAALIVALISLALPLCTRAIAKIVLNGDLAQQGRQVLQTGLLMFALVLVNAVCNYYFDYRGHALGARMESDLRDELFDHYQKLSFSFYDEHRTGQLMSRLSHDLLSLAELYHHGPEEVILYAVKLVGTFVILLQMNVQLSVIVFAFLVLIGGYALIFNRKLHDALKTNKERIADVNVQVEDSLAGIRVVKSFTNEALERSKFSLENFRFLQSRKATYRSEAFFFGGVDTFTRLISVAVIVFGGVSALRGSIDLADLLAFLLYVENLVEPIQMFIHLASLYQEGTTGFERFMEIMETQPEIQDSPDAVALSTVSGKIDFRQVGFAYKTSATPVLADVSLSIRPGEFIALVGYSGVGKTTLCSLIPRFYDVTAGAILLDGVDVRKIQLDSLRRQIGIVQQDVFLFAGTVAENIAYGRPGASLEEIIQAARKANAHNFIQALPQRYATDIGQRGVKLSGGQKQRLSIARVFLKNPPVLIFDEATSSLDYESEKVVQKSLAGLALNRTTLVIAHRLSTIRNADRIVVLSAQGVEEQGTHDQLLSTNGTYAHLYQLQFEPLG